MIHNSFQAKKYVGLVFRLKITLNNLATTKYVSCIHQLTLNMIHMPCPSTGVIYNPNNPTNESTEILGLL